MFPIRPTYNARDSRNGYAESLRYDRTIAETLVTQRANLKNFRLGQLRRRAFFSTRLSSLVHFVVLVVGVRGLKQMSRIAAQGPVAFMANKQGRPVTITEKERDTMGSQFPNLAVLLFLKKAVAVFRSASPSPTVTLRAVAGSLVNVLPKAINLLLSENRRVSINSSHSLYFNTVGAN